MIWLQLQQTSLCLSFQLLVAKQLGHGAESTNKRAKVGLDYVLQVWKQLSGLIPTYSSWQGVFMCSHEKKVKNDEE